MLRLITTVVLNYLLVLLPLSSYAQTCQTSSILATTPSAQFTDHADGTITDTKTGLKWKKCSEGQVWNNVTGGCDGSITNYIWKNAIQQAQSINNNGGFAGYFDWRLPNKNELLSIVENQCSWPAINLTVFPDTPVRLFWSSSPVTPETLFVKDSDRAWGVTFYYGNSFDGDKNDNCGVRLVRSEL
ncbi:Lcl C-terminal domain-containing protein [Candidatus Thiothrix anitrata]|uniref:Lcl C-terminal domain-containing protein n=1 Tax=Candidatus Thiothrix anitrata TaxID=2823902 RepID=UPI001D1971E6|nr:DUF1566 domain-containing protein [Candidatus Thiothrix anitrata]